MTLLEMTFAVPSSSDEEQSHHHHVTIDTATVNLPLTADALPDGEEPPKVSRPQ